MGGLRVGYWINNVEVTNDFDKRNSGGAIDMDGSVTGMGS